RQRSSTRRGCSRSRASVWRCWWWASCAWWRTAKPRSRGKDAQSPATEHVCGPPDQNPANGPNHPGPAQKRSLW
ncbi:hypothetical protein AAFF_G00184080, partial [Aldrovandia affinis]